LKKYVVACYLDYTNDVEQRVIRANNEFDAVVDFLQTKPPGINDLDELLEWCWDQEMIINLIEIN
jgi:hypothetical protein